MLFESFAGEELQPSAAGDGWLGKQVVWGGCWYVPGLLFVLILRTSSTCAHAVFQGITGSRSCSI